MESLVTLTDIHISKFAIEKILAFDFHLMDLECAGYLVGYLKGSTLFIEDMETGSQRSSSTHVEINNSALPRIAMSVIGRETEDGIPLSLVGWWHSHPKMSAGFLSRTDINTQSSFQAMFPQAIAIVIDSYKCGKSKNTEDLDLKAYQLVNRDDYVKIPYTIESYVVPSVAIDTFDEVPTVEEIAITLSKFNQDLKIITIILAIIFLLFYIAW